MEKERSPKPYTRARHVCHLVWATVGILALVWVAGIVMSRLSLVIVPLVLALFPATLLMPVTHRLERWHVPGVLASLITLIGGILLLLGTAVGVTTLVVSEIPEIVSSADAGIEGIEELVGQVVPGFEFPALHEVRDMVRTRIEEKASEAGEGSGDLASQSMSVATRAINFVVGIVLMVVILFFFLKNGRGLAEGFAAFIAPRHCRRILSLADEAWKTLGAYFRGQLLVALADAVFIGIGLLILGVPLAFPLAVIVFFGGLFPIVGAVSTGALAVLVGFSDGGLGIGLAVAAIVLVVQQVEGNVLEPLILSNVIDLKPLTVILSITAGALVLGVLGAFLAVPLAAITKRIIVRMREPDLISSPKPLAKGA